MDKKIHIELLSSFKQLQMIKLLNLQILRFDTYKSWSCPSCGEISMATNIAIELFDIEAEYFC